MIWSLAREQLRSQGRFVISAAVVIAVAVAVAAYGGLMTLTLTHSQGQVDHFFGYDRDSVADASTGAGYDFATLAPNIDAANAAGHSVVAVASAWPMLPPLDPYGYDEVVALYGDVDWSPMLVEGSAPRTGEIAVSAQWAKAAGVVVGDDIALATTATDDVGNAAPLDRTLRVSGITRSSVATAGVQLYVPSGYVAWDDVPGLNQAEAEALSEGKVKDGTPVMSEVGVTVSGNGNWPWSEALAVSANSGGASAGPATAIATIAGIGFAALVIGLVAMAFALGRAQAQARTKWVGTVRALGATQRQVATASLLESAAVGVAAGVAGVVLGALGAVAHFATIGARVASPMILRAPGGLGAVVVAAVVLAVVLALVVGVVPAFWSARLAPTAALKPVTDVSEAEVSRRVKTWPLVVAWAVSLGAAILGALFGVDGMRLVPAVIAGTVLVVTSLMLAHEVLRASLPWHAGRMSRSLRRPVMVAGDAILARPRQSTIPAFIVALAMTVFAGLLLPNVAAEAALRNEYLVNQGSDYTSANPYLEPLPMLGVFAVVTFLCVIIAAATASVTAREAATREALGLTRREGRIAAALQYLAAQLHGLVLGVVGALMVAGFLLPTAYDAAYSEVSSGLGPVIGAVALVYAIAAACAVAGAATTAALAPRTAPLARVEVAA